MACDMEVTSSSVAQASIALLPPCRVCGEKASGFHYGANTCEACKGFFRRSLQRKEVYKCIGEGDCEVGPGKRSTCAHCRYRKCLTVGMAKSAIKTGRYTHEKKTRDIREVKRLQLQEKLKSEGKAFIFPESREQELEQIVRHITTVHQQQTPHTPEFFEKLPEREKEFLEQRELQREMFGTMRPLPRDEYMQIYNSTGIDIDGRREMIKHMIPCIEKAIKRFISFAKALPGFKDLPIDDQIALIKASKFECWIITVHKSFNQEHKLYTTFWGMTDDIEGLRKFLDPEYLDLLFDLAGKIQALELTVEERIVLMAFNMMFTDRCELKAPAMVDKCQEELLDTMRYILAKNRYNHSEIFLRCLQLMVQLRTAAWYHCKEEKKMTTDWTDTFSFPQIMLEMWSY